jgi:hypothetical protein
LRFELTSPTIHLCHRRVTKLPLSRVGSFISLAASFLAALFAANFFDFFLRHFLSFGHDFFIMN